MGHGKIQNNFFEKIKVLYLIDGQLKSTCVFRILKSWFLWQWQAYKIHLINMGHSKPKFVFSQIWLVHMKLMPKWLKKTFLFGLDIIEISSQLKPKIHLINMGQNTSRFFLSQIIKLMHLTTNYYFGQVSKLIRTILKMPLKLTW